MHTAFNVLTVQQLIAMAKSGERDTKAMLCRSFPAQISSHCPAPLGWLEADPRLELVRLGSCSSMPTGI